VINRDDGHGDSVGICQVQLRTAAYMGYRGTERGLLGPGTNVFYAAKYLRYQFDRYGDWEKAVAAYNAGRYEPGINQDYVDKVLAIYCGNTGNPKDALTPRKPRHQGQACNIRRDGNKRHLPVSNPARSNF
jgi:hypothetical protein